MKGNYAIKKQLKQNPFLMDLIAKIYNTVHNLRFIRPTQNTIQTRGAFLNKVKFHISGKNNRISIGRMARLRNCTFNISGNNCIIEIGGGSTVISNVSFCCQDNNSNLYIGRHFTMEGGHIASTEGESIVIGEDCMFSGDIEIRNGDSHSIIEQNTNKRINWAKPVRIGDHVWLTAHVRILKGSVIASHSIVGNSSVVSGNLSDSNAIYSGNPAKLCKTNIDWDRNRFKFTKSKNLQ